MIRHRFTSLLLAMAALLSSAAVSAQTPGYALYGDVPSGYTDLTSNVQVVAPAVISGQNLSSTDHVAPAAEGIAFTGRGHSNHYCQGSADLSIRFSENQSLTLTDQYAIHIKIKRTNAGSGDIQMSYIRNNWGSVRVGFLMAAAKLSDTESEIVLKYADRKQNGGGQYYCNGENQTYGTRTYNGGDGSEIFRMTAANGEAFLITSIYLEATYTPTPGPGPEPESEPTGEKRYYFFRGGDLPTIDGVTMVDLREGAGTTIGLNNMVKGTATEYIAYTLNGSWFSFNQNLKTATDMSDVKQASWALKLKVRTNVNQNSFNLRLNNAGECWMISSGNLPLTHNGEWEDITLPLSTSSKSLNFTSSMTGTIFQMHANGSANGNILDIAYAYLTNDPSSDETPVDDSDTEAPTGLTIEEKTKTHNAITVTVSATDEQSPITYTFYNGEDVVGTATATSGENKDYTITGLSPETEYTIGVKAKDLSNNETTKTTINITTDAAPAAVRYYIVGGDNPIDCNVAYNGGAYRDERITEYFSAKLGNSWSAIDFKPKATIENTINDDWYVVMRFRSCMDNGYAFGFNHTRLNLVNNGANYYMNSSEWAPYGNGTWQIVKYKLANANGTKPTQYLQANQIAVQLHVESGATMRPGDYIDIEYIYFTNDISTIDPGVQTGKKLMMGEDRDNSALLNVTEGATFDVDFGRSFVADGYLYTLCLPFNMDAEKAAMYFPGTYSYLESSELRGELIHLNMEYSDHIEAGRPYLYLPSQDVPAYFFKDITIDAEETTLRSTTYFDMKGIYSPTVLEQGVDYFLGNDNYLYLANDGSKLKGFRAYFTINESAPAGVPARVVFNHQTATDIENVNDNDNANKILRDGNIYILRGEKVFTISGQLVK